MKTVGRKFDIISYVTFYWLTLQLETKQSSILWNTSERVQYNIDYGIQSSMGGNLENPKL